MGETPLRRFLSAVLLGAAAIALIAPDPAEAGRRRGGGGGGGSPHEAVGSQTFASPQVNPLALSANGAFLYVANTTSNSVSVITTSNNNVFRTIEVGMEPVSVAVRPGTPDPGEVWVSNHVSDSVSVIDVSAGSDTQFTVVETIQSFDAHGASTFDEPVGIAFTADGSKAYVALSSRDQVAIVDTTTYLVTGTLDITAQEPRALAVRNGLLYVAAFESGNKTEVSACVNNLSSFQCSMGIADLATFAMNPNMPGFLKHIVVDPQVPDRDLFVFDTSGDSLITSVTGVGTLLYGLAVDSTGEAYITHTDARNDENGRVAAFGPDDQNGDGVLNLADLENRMFLNRVARVSCSLGGCSFTPGSDLLDLEPATPTQATALATPFGVAVSGDDAILVATAAASSRVFTVDTTSFTVDGVLDLGSGASAGQQIPRGVVVAPSAGAAQTAYVLNTLENTVSVVDVSDPSNLVEVAEINVGSDPTPTAVRLGRIAFNNAFASTNGTFACAGCHPDGNTDQLLWRIGGKCFLDEPPAGPGPEDCNGLAGEDEPRTTMPVRGLKHTVPLHWDGTLGDPFGGGNGAYGDMGSPPQPIDCAGEHDCFVDLAEESLAGVMCDQDPVSNPSGCPAGGNELSAQEIDDMATFLASVSYPPARARRMDDTLSMPGEGVEVGEGMDAMEVSALVGFQDFFTDQGGGASDPDTCADSTAGCHELPLGVAHNSSTLNGFDAPTMRGMTDRFLQFSLGPTAAEEIQIFANSGFPPDIDALEDPIQYSAAAGIQEITVFGAAFAIFQPTYGTRPLDTFQMFEEASTGFSGAQGRQVSVHMGTTTGGNLAATEAIMNELEAADERGLVNLRAVGVRRSASTGNFVEITYSYRADTDLYTHENGTVTLSHAQIISEAQAGDLSVTLTAALREGFGAADAPQPLLAQDGTGSGVTGDPPLPQLGSGGPSNPPPFDVQGVDVRADAVIFVDGVIWSGTLTCIDGQNGNFCNDGTVEIDLDVKPATGLHMLQVQNPKGPLSNELPFCIGNKAACT